MQSSVTTFKTPITNGSGISESNMPGGTATPGTPNSKSKVHIYILSFLSSNIRTFNRCDQINLVTTKKKFQDSYPNSFISNICIENKNEIVHLKGKQSHL